MAEITPELALKNAILLLKAIHANLSDERLIPEAIQLSRFLIQRLQEGNRFDIVGYATDLQSALSAKDINRATQIITLIYTAITEEPARQQPQLQAIDPNRAETLKAIQSTSGAISMLLQIAPALRLSNKIVRLFREIGEEKMAAFAQEHLVETLEKSDIHETLEVILQISGQMNQALTNVASSSTLCPKCGKPVAGTNFCRHCGFRLVANQAVAHVVSPVNACPNCGKPIKTGTTFCRYCGVRLVAA